MNEKQLFSVLVRGLGVLVFVEGLNTLYTAFVSWEIFKNTVNQSFVVAAMTSGLIYALFALALGVAMIRWPEWLVRLAWLERLPTIDRMDDDAPSD